MGIFIYYYLSDERYEHERFEWEKNLFTNDKKFEFLFKENNFAIPYRELYSWVNTNKWIYLSILTSVIGEFLIYEEKIQGLFIHLGNLLAIIFLIIFGGLSLGTRNILQSLSLLSILRIIDFSMPPFFTDMNQQYILIYGVMLIPIFSVIKNQWTIFSVKNQWTSRDVKNQWTSRDVKTCEKCRNETEDDAAYCTYCGTKIERQQNFGIFFYLPIVILAVIIILMVGQYARIVTNIHTVDIGNVDVGGELASILLIVCISISFMISNTKYWNRYNSDSINMCTYPLLLTFLAIVIFKINMMIM